MNHGSWQASTDRCHRPEGIHGEDGCCLHEQSWRRAHRNWPFLKWVDTLVEASLTAERCYVIPLTMQLYVDDRASRRTPLGISR